VSRVHGRAETDSEERRTFFFEFVAAFGILAIMALVLYLVLTYRPA
jgi:hypothetical protein